MVRERANYPLKWEHCDLTKSREPVDHVLSGRRSLSCLFHQMRMIHVIIRSINNNYNNNNNLYYMWSMFCFTLLLLFCLVSWIPCMQFASFCGPVACTTASGKGSISLTFCVMGQISASFPHRICVHILYLPLFAYICTCNTSKTYTSKCAYQRVPDVLKMSKKKKRTTRFNHTHLWISYALEMITSKQFSISWSKSLDPQAPSQKWCPSQLHRPWQR